MKITINKRELINILTITPPQQNIMLTGKHGIGKSEIVTDFYERQGLRVVPLFLGQMSDPGDIIGLPHLNTETGRTEFMPPYWFPTDENPVVLFLDELNRARPEILQTIMDLVLNRTIAGRKLPEGSRIVSAVNSGDEYQLTDLDPALVSRFNIYYFAPDATDWITWARAKKLDERVVSFIEENTSMLDCPIPLPENQQTASDSEEDDLEKTPDRRGWERVAQLLTQTKEITPVYEKAIAGIVGMKAAVQFMVSLRKGCGMGESAEKILSGGIASCADIGTYKIPQICTLTDTLLAYLDAANSTSAVDAARYAKHLSEYMDWLVSTHKREEIAYFATVFSGMEYQKANMFIASKCPGVYTTLSDFVKNNNAVNGGVDA